MSRLPVIAPHAILALSVLSFAPQASGMRNVGSLPAGSAGTSGDQVHYIGKFCFDKQRWGLASALPVGGESGGSGDAIPCEDCVQLKNLRSGKCLAASDGWSSASGSQQVPCAAANHFWYDAATRNLVDVASSLCLDVSSESTSAGATLGLYACKSPAGENQVFDFAKISNALTVRHSKMCLQVGHGGRGVDDDGAPVTQQRCAPGGDAAQQWMLAKPAAHGARLSTGLKDCGDCVRLRNANSQLCLRVPPGGGGSDQCPCAFATTFQFDRHTGIFLEPLSGLCLHVPGASWADQVVLGLADCSYQSSRNYQFDYDAHDKWIKVRHSGLCLDVAGGDPSEGAAVSQYTCHQKAHQQWDMDPVKAGDFAGLALTLRSLGSGLCLRITDIGATSHQADCSDATRFQLDRKAGLLRDTSTGGCLDVMGAGKSDEVRLTLWECGFNPPWNRRFTLAESGAGPVRSWLSGKCLAVAGGAGAASGAVVYQSTCAEDPFQQWSMVEVPNDQAAKDETQPEESGLVTLEVRGHVIPVLTDADEEAPGAGQFKSGDTSVHFTDPGEARQGLYLALFDDTEQGEWGQIRARWRSNGLTCQEFLKLARYVRPIAAGKDVLSASIRLQKFLRPRFLYFSLVLCGAKAITPIEYDLSARNSLAGYRAEFSKEDMGTLPTHAVGCGLFCVVLLGSWLCSTWRHGVGELRRRYPLQFLMLSCALSASGSLSLALHYWAYSRDGAGLVGLRVAGQVLSCLGRVSLSLLQLFMVRGKTLLGASSGGQQEDGRRQTYLRGLVVAIVVLDVGCELYGRYLGHTDWSTTLYFYESWPGLLVLCLNALLFAEVVAATRSVLEGRRADSGITRYYTVTFVAAVVYFAAMPLTCLLAVYIPPWDRKWVVNRAEITVRLVATLVLAVWFQPRRIDHKIAATMELADGYAQATHEQPLSAGLYEPLGAQGPGLSS